MAITNKVTAKPSQETALSWADMAKTVNTVVNELRAGGVKLKKENEPVRGPSYYRQFYICLSGEESIPKILKARGFKTDKLGTMGKRVGSYGVAVDYDPNDNMIEIVITDFDGPQEEPF
jgi:hypothetical protein